jgi:hypothetical protein
MTPDDLAVIIVGILFLSLVSALASPAKKAPPPAKPKKTLS